MKYSFPEQVEEEREALAAIFMEDFCLEAPDCVLVKFAVEPGIDLMASQDRVEGEEEEFMPRLELRVRISEFYPREAPLQILVGGEMSETLRTEAEMLLRAAAKRTVGSPVIFQLVEELREWAACQPDLSAAHTLEEAAQLRCSVESAPRRILDPVYITALVVIPPKVLWPRIQKVRGKCDRGFQRWPPHITLLYPFVPESEFEVSADLLYQVLGDIQPFNISLQHTGRFGKKTLWLRPDTKDGELTLVQSRAKALFSETGGNKPFTPHLTLGQDVEAIWDSREKLSWTCDELYMLSRRGKDDPMVIRRVIGLAGREVEQPIAPVAQPSVSRKGAVVEILIKDPVGPLKIEEDVHLQSSEDALTCITCGTKVNSSAIHVGNDWFCTKHATSTSSRHIPKSSMASQSQVGASDKVDLQIRGAKQILPRFAAMLAAGTLQESQYEVMQEVLLYSVSILPGERTLLSEALTAIRSGEPATQGASLRDCVAQLESLERRKIFSPALKRWFISFISRSGHFDEGSQLEEPLIEELRLLASVYGHDFALRPLDLEEEQAGITHVVRFTVGSVGASVELLLKFSPSDPPQVFFGMSEGLLVGDLVVLESMTRNLRSSLRIASVVQDYVSDVSAMSVVPESALQFDYVPSDQNLTQLRFFKDSICKPMNLELLDNLMMKQLQRKVNDTRYLVSLSGKKVRQDAFRLHHVENVVTPKTWMRFKECARNMYSHCEGKKKFLPVVAWHGTRSLRGIEGIINAGILQNGEMNERSGRVIRVQSGSVFGEGVYTSPDLGLSHWYAYRDSQRTGQVFFCIVLLGNAEILNISDSATWDRYGDASGIHSEYYDSAVIPELQTYVSFDSAQVLPFFLVTYGPATDHQLQLGVFEGASSAFPDTRSEVYSVKHSKKVATRKERKRERRRKQRVMSQWNAIKKALAPRDMTFSDSLARDLPRVQVHPLPGIKGHHLLTLSSEEIANLWLFSNVERDESPTDLRCIFIVDKSSSMGASFKNLALPACAQLYRGLDPSAAQVLLFGKSIDIISADKVQHAGFFESLADTQLEGATNLFQAVKAAVDLAMRDQHKISLQDQERRMDVSRRYGCEPSEIAPRRPVFCFFLLSDGGDTVSSAVRAQTLLSDCSKMVNGSSMSAIFRAINIGRGADTKATMRCKLTIETISAYEATPVVYARKRRYLPRLVQEQLRELNSMLTNAWGRGSLQTVNLKISSKVTFEGFVEDFALPPRHQATVAMRDDAPVTLLIRGPAPRVLEVDHVTFQVEVAPQETFSTPRIQNDTLRLLRGLVDHLKVSAVAGHDVKTAVQQLKELIDDIKQEAFNADALLNLDGQARVLLMRRKKTLVNELREMLNEVRNVLAMQGATSDAQAQWLVRADKLKFGLSTLRRAAGAVPMPVIRKQLLQVANASDEMQPQPSDFKSVHSGLSAFGHLRELKLRPPPPSLSISETLYSVSCTGLAIRVRRSEAAVADPWMLAVEYVSPDVWDTASALCSLDADLEWRDSNGVLCTDVLVVHDVNNPSPTEAFMRTSLHDCYTAVVFTRNTDLALKSQKTALLSLSAVRAVTLLLDAKKRSDRFIAACLDILWSVRGRMERSEYWSNMLNKLMSDDPSKHLTEAPEDDVSNIGKVLSAAMALPELVQPIYADKQRMSTVSLALLAEAVSRGARLVVKQRQKKRGLQRRDEAQLQLLERVLGITPESCEHPAPLGEKDEVVSEHSGEFDVARARKLSGQFFSKESRMSICPPQSVLACITMAGVLTPAMYRAADWRQSGNATVHAVHAAFDNLTMRSFLVDFVLADGLEDIECSPMELQIALYAQGLRFCSSKTRREGVPSLREPRPVIIDLAKDTRRRLYNAEMSQKLKVIKEAMAKDQRAQSRQLKIHQQLEFLQTHDGPPRLFSFREIAELNKNRPEYDQLELTHGGLLKHHCCYEKCSEFLVDQRTEKDRKFENSRRGLFKHLKFLTFPVDSYVPALHLYARSVAQKEPRMSVERFIELMMAFLKREKNNKRKRRVGMTWECYFLNMFERVIQLFGKYEEGKTGTRGSGQRWFEALSPARQQEISKQMTDDIQRLTKK